VVVGFCETKVRRDKKRKRKKEAERKKEVVAAEHIVFFLRFPARSPLDRFEFWTEASRHIDLHSERLD